MKGGTTDEAFKEPCFQWETGASVGSLTLLTFKNLPEKFEIKLFFSVSAAGN